MVRWIPCYDYIQEEVVAIKEGRSLIDYIPNYALAKAPLPWSLLLMNETSRALDAELNFLRGRTIALVGCSCVLSCNMGQRKEGYLPNLADSTALIAMHLY